VGANNIDSGTVDKLQTMSGYNIGINRRRATPKTQGIICILKLVYIKLNSVTGLRIIDSACSKSTPLIHEELIKEIKSIVTSDLI
jgi:hypothetical protein